MKKLCPQRVLLSLYYALIYSHLSYGICVWGNADDSLLEKIRVAQKKVVRILGNADYLAPTLEIFKSLNILNLDESPRHKKKLGGSFFLLHPKKNHQILKGVCFSGMFFN